MRIRFSDSVIESDFRELDRLERRYGSALAARIATRIGVLIAARNLDEVPIESPIRLRTFDTRTGQFTVDLGRSNRLRFRACKGYAQRNGQIVYRTVEEIEVRGVD